LKTSLALKTWSSDSCWSKSTELDAKTGRHIHVSRGKRQFYILFSLH
jgi:hypothetical protein